MFTLKVTKQDGSIEQSDFKTNDEAIVWQAHLVDLGYNFNTSTIYHDEIPAIEGRDAVLDENGLEISPAIIAVDKVLAWDEVIPAPCTYEIITIKEVIADISPRQFFRALDNISITEDMILTAIENAPSNILSDSQKKDAKYAILKSLNYIRAQPAVSLIGQLLGLNSDQLDALWQAGAGL